MNEVSNKTIVALLAVALVVSVAGTLYSVSELNDLGMIYTSITGASVTETGTAEINITSTVGISVTDGAIDLGSGYYNVSCTSGYGYIATDNDATECWLTANGETFTSIDDHHDVENNGTTAANVSVAFNSANAEVWLCAGNSCTSNVAGIGVKMTDTSSGCVGDEEQTTYTSLATYTAKDAVVLCSELGQADDSDDIEVNFNITIPDDTRANSGATAVITYEAAESG